MKYDGDDLDIQMQELTEENFLLKRLVFDAPQAFSKKSSPEAFADWWQRARLVDFECLN